MFKSVKKTFAESFLNGLKNIFGRLDQMLRTIVLVGGSLRGSAPQLEPIVERFLIFGTLPLNHYLLPTVITN